MAFRVEIAPRAFQDLDYIKERGSFGQAQKWFNFALCRFLYFQETLPGDCQLLRPDNLIFGVSTSHRFP